MYINENWFPLRSYFEPGVGVSGYVRNRGTGRLRIFFASLRNHANREPGHETDLLNHVFLEW